MKITRLAWGLAAVMLCSGVARAQSLGDVAKKEEERRKTVKGAGKVYTNDDLRRYPVAVPQQGPGTEAASAPDTEKIPDPVAAAKAQQAAAAPEKAEDKKDEAWWRQRIAAARAAMRRGETHKEAMQTRVNSLTNDFYARDDPAQRAVIWQQRVDALGEMDRLTQEISDLNKEIASIEEEARKEGVPPGWLR